MFKFKMIYGVLLCSVLALAALLISKYIPIGMVTLAIILGIIIGNTLKLSVTFQQGITYSEKNILSFAIALLGIKLNYKIIAELGYTTLLIIMLAMFVTIITAIILGKVFKVEQNLVLLVGIGNGVCGSSAIAASKNILEASEEDVGLSVAVINVLGAIGIFLLPFIAQTVLHFTDMQSGVLIGNTLQAVGQVVAAGFSVNELTGTTATVV